MRSYAVARVCWAPGKCWQASMKFLTAIVGWCVVRRSWLRVTVPGNAFKSLPVALTPGQ